MSSTQCLYGWGMLIDDSSRQPSSSVTNTSTESGQSVDPIAKQFFWRYVLLLSLTWTLRVQKNSSCFWSFDRRRAANLQFPMFSLEYSIFPSLKGWKIEHRRLKSIRAFSLKCRRMDELKFLFESLFPFSGKLFPATLPVILPQRGAAYFAGRE